MTSVASILAVSPAPDGGYRYFNTAEGEDALFSLTTDASVYGNTAVGYQAQYNNQLGFDNTAVGKLALFTNVSGYLNTAVGSKALYSTTGSGNTAVGAGSLQFDTTGGGNTAVGDQALWDNTTGFSNTAVGLDALLENTTGIRNSAMGANALAFAGGSDNVAIGADALDINTIGSNNIAVGSSAGSQSLGSNNIYLGNNGSNRDSGAIRIGTVGTQTSTRIAGISGVTVAGGVNVIVDSRGQLGTVTSSAAYKEAIKPMGKASEALLALQPVTFRYKKALDPAGIPQFGLVAEEVEKVDPDLIGRDDQGKPYTVRYEAVNAMLLNEFLKEHRQVEELRTEVVELKEALAEQRAQIKEVSNQMRASGEPSPLVSASN